MAFPAHASLAGLDERSWSLVLPTLKPKLVLPNPPMPLKFDGPKLVHDRWHPFMPAGPDDVRGPCPGLNTLASHGYLPRSGVASPAQIITAAMEGFNMENKLAVFTTYAAHLVDGNVVTDLLSIGDKTPRTGKDTPPPAIIGGMNNHGTFEGDASLTRGDAFHGDNHNFNQTLFDQLAEFSNTYGAGFFNMTVAAELRFQRIQESIATNPEFTLFGFRHITAYAEASFPSQFFVDGRTKGTPMEGQLDMPTALSFFRDMRFPAGFHRAAAPVIARPELIFEPHPVMPGRNMGGINTFAPDNSLGGLTDGCTFYTQFAEVTVKGLYPNPKGILKKNLQKNLRFLFDALPFPNCTEVFPFGMN